MLAVSPGLGPGWVGGRCCGTPFPLLQVSFSTDVLSGLCFHSSCLYQSRGTRCSFGDPGCAPSQAAGCVGRVPWPQHWEEPPRAEIAFLGAGPFQYRAPETLPSPGVPPRALVQEQGPRPPCPPVLVACASRGGSSSQANEGAPATTSLESSWEWAGRPPWPGLPCGWFSSWEQFNL